MIDYGTGILLNVIDRGDVPDLFRWRNDSRVSKWTRQNDLIPWAHHEDWFERQSKDPKIKMYKILSLEKALIGVCGLTNMDLLNRNAEFSLYIAPERQRQGYGKQALKSLISHGFNAYGMQVIWGESFENNPATKMFLDVGMKSDGIRRNFYFREGRFINAHLFSVLHSEWETSETFQDCRAQRCFM